MREQAKNSKEPGTGILEKHLDSSTILAFRDRDGKGELHQQFGDVFVVLQGTATLVTGGTITSPTTTAPGEIRGASIEQGVRKKLQEGDIAHIPAGVPHQLVLDAGGTFTYFVVKIPVEMRTSSGSKGRTRLAFTRRIPGLKRETWGTLRVSNAESA